MLKNHMIKLEGTDKMLVKRLNMIPIECVVRGYLYGSLFDRYKHGQLQHHESFVANPQLASKLKLPIFDPTTKSNIQRSSHFGKGDSGSANSRSQRAPIC